MRSSRTAPFFHALVVAGAGIAATDCGGVTREGDTSSGEGRDGGAAASTGGARSGGSSSGGGRRPMNGGSTSVGGGTAPGGGAASGGTGGADPIQLSDAPTMAQWDCSGSLSPSCLYGRGITRADPELLGPCKVDPSRPRTPAECRRGEWFSCDAARVAQHETTILVQCECVPMADAGCSGCDFATCVDTTRVCGCANPVILR